MRFFYYDVRDMPQAIVLACNLRRVVHACYAMLWTFCVVLGLFSILNFRATGSLALSPSGMYAAIETLGRAPVTLGRLAFWGCILLGWWLGFGYLNAPVLRGAALEIARDERGKLAPEPFLFRMAAVSPVLAMGIPALLAGVILLWSLLAHIPGAAGGVTLVLTLPLALVCALVAALGGLLFLSAAPMMPAAAVVEGRDYLEAFSKPAGFVLQKPFRYAGYLLAKVLVVLLATVAGALVLGLAWGLVAGCMAVVGAWEVIEGAWVITSQPQAAIETAQLPHFAVASVFWASVATLLCWLSAVSQSADLLTYLLMRYRIEGATFDQVAVAEERLKQLATAIQTAEQAEEARKRFDDQQAAKPDAMAPQAPKEAENARSE
ncbi:MAG: hypothetical protein KF754_04880 [Planctomycetes bacterium]|nr:hypothetical protein [Planctomycetota bacterium]